RRARAGRRSPARRAIPWRVGGSRRAPPGAGQTVRLSRRVPGSIRERPEALPLGRRARGAAVPEAVVALDERTQRLGEAGGNLSAQQVLAVRQAGPEAQRLALVK